MTVIQGSDVEGRLRAAVIGVGSGEHSSAKGGSHQVGYLHTKLYKSTPAISTLAGADIRPENLSIWQERFDCDLGFADYRVMLDEYRPDLVSICTYVGTHAEMIAACAQAGVRAIICEKPFLATPREIVSVTEQVKVCDLKLVVPHFRRYHPAFLRMRELVSAGAIGRPLLICAGIPGWDLSEWGSHWLDMFRFLNDDARAEWVFGQARVRDARGYGHAMEEQAIAYFGLSNGCKGMLDGGGDLAQPFRMVVSGSDGELRLSGEYLLEIIDSEGSREERYPDDASELLPTWQLMLDDLLDWMNGGSEPHVGFANAVAATELSLGAYVSALSRDRADLPLGDVPVDEWPLEILARESSSAGLIESV
jgi:predicted dehydrogenase